MRYGKVSALLLALLMLVTGCATANSSVAPREQPNPLERPQAAQEEPSTVPDESQPVTPLSPKVLGSDQAPVNLVEYADFQCIWCARAYTEVWPQLRDLIDAGHLRYEFRHRIVINDDSLLAAEASECAAEQGKFWDYFDALFANYSGERGLNRDVLVEHAHTAGLDSEAFNRCLDSHRYRNAIVVQDAEAQSNGVDGTPAWEINGQLFWPQTSLQEVVTAVQSAIDNVLQGKAN